MLTNKEAIKWVEYVANESSMTFDDDSDETRLIREKAYANIKQALIMAIDALNQTAWIPVWERLPDIDQIVLICTGDGQITDGYRWNSEDWFLAWGEFNGGHTGGEYAQIVAWMPLPEPYKGGEDE